MLSKIQSNAVVQGLLQGDESGKGPLLFFITSNDPDRGLVSALHIGGPSFEALRVGSRLHMVVEEGENSIRFDASVLDLHPPDRADFMVLSSASVSGKRGYSRVEDHLCYECEVLRGTEEEAKERFRKKGSRRASPQATSLASFAMREDRAGVSELDREVVRLLAGLDAKMDAILRFLSLGDRAGLSFFAPRWISLSGSGARLLVNEAMTESDFLDVRIQVPDMLSTPVAALGKVIRILPLPGGGGEGGGRGRLLRPRLRRGPGPHRPLRVGEDPRRGAPHREEGGEGVKFSRGGADTCSMAAWSGNTRGSGGDDRAFRVERIREALEDGTFRVDGAAVAARMVEEAVRTLRALPRPALREAPLPGGGDQAK